MDKVKEKAQAFADETPQHEHGISNATEGAERVEPEPVADRYVATEVNGAQPIVKN